MKDQRVKNNETTSTYVTVIRRIL